MSKQQDSQLFLLGQVEKGIADAVSSIKRQTNVLSAITHDEAAWQGTPEDLAQHKASVMALLSRVYNDLNTLSHPVVVLRAAVSQGK